ncbi:MAG: hypothetical protein L6R40_007289 [Gallowayella cf. fulva]|nr:MAG: hypothetical protein L6R40_007289 [Xanthomendoza cf. fulva]
MLPGFNSHSKGPMAFSVAAHPPCPYSSETALPPKLDINVGAKSHFFQPPALSAVETLQQSTASIESDHHVASSTNRKRSRHQYSLSDSATPCTATSRGWTIPSGYNTPNVVSPAPFVNTQYRLAGGLDTPTAALSTSLVLGQDEPSPFRAHRRMSRSKHRGMSDEDYFSRVPSALSREANGRPRLQARHMTNDGWGKTIYDVIGVAGKVWSFCKSNAFRGFYAGKGPGYAMTPSIFPANEESQLWHDMDEKEFSFDEGGHVSIPGRFPEDFIEDYMSQDHTVPPRAAKKIQRSKGQGNMREDWVLVGRSPISSRDGSPVRLSNRKVPQSSPSGRRALTRTARRPVLPTHTPSLTSQAGSPGMRSDHSASFASTRSPVTSPKHESPVSADVQRHAARIRRRELQEDANLKRFNQQLKAMIRQGKEALRTTVEVADMSDAPFDEGYIEGDYADEREKG